MECQYIYMANNMVLKGSYLPAQDARILVEYWIWAPVKYSPNFTG